MNEAPLLSRNATGAPISSGWPTRPIGELASNPSRAVAMPRAGASIGVSMYPGHTALTRTPCRPRWSAMERTAPSRPALEAQ